MGVAHHPNLLQKSQKKPKSQKRDSTTSPWPCAEILEVVLKFVASCCCSYYFTVPPFEWFIKAPKSLTQHTCKKNGSIFNPHLQCLLTISNTPYNFDYYTIKYFYF